MADPALYFPQRVQLGVQAAVFAAAQKQAGHTAEQQAKLMTEAAGAETAGRQMNVEMGYGENGTVLTIVTRKHLLTFGQTPADHSFEGGVPGLAAKDQEDVRRWMNSLIARARGVWTQWAAENGSDLKLEFDAARLVLRFERDGQKTGVGVGFTLVELD